MKIEKKPVEYFIEGYLECFMYFASYQHEDIDDIMISFSTWINARQGNYQGDEAKEYIETLKENRFFDNYYALKNALMKMLQNHFPDDNPENKFIEMMYEIKAKVESRFKNSQNLKKVN